MDRTELQALYDNYGYAVHHRCLRFLGSPSDADDALQEVFVRVMRYGHRFDGKNPLGWLYRISDCQCIDVIKKNRRQVPVENTEEWASHTDSEGEWGRGMLSGHTARQIIASSHPKDARIAILYYVDEMTQKEVADEMGCSRKTVKKRLARFKELARRFQKGESDG